MATETKQPLSKSQKKRAKRNASKAKRAEAEEVSATKQDKPTQDPLNPHAKLRQDLLSLGYSEEEIDNGMEEMWNYGMKYDELEVVVSYLEEKRTTWAKQVKEDPISEQQINIGEGDVVAEEKGNFTEEKPISAAIVEDDSYNPVAENIPTERVETHEAVEEVAQAPEQDATEEEPAPTMDLISRLEVVAAFENLQDALFALSEWVNKAAKAEELLDFCGVQNEISFTVERSPFATVVKRSVLQQGDNDDYYRSVVFPYLHSIFTGLLATHHDSITVVDQMLNVIFFSRKAISDVTSSALPANVPEDIASSVSLLIAAMVRNSLNKSNEDGSSAQSTNGVLHLQQLKAEMSQMLTDIGNQPPMKNAGVVELMTQRDSRKCLAEKASELSKALFRTMSDGTGSVGAKKPLDMSSYLLQSNDAKLSMFSSLLGDHYSSVQTGVGSYREIESRLKSLQADLTIKHAEVAAESLRVHSDLQRIARRKEELRLELEQLERNELMLHKRETELNAILTDAEGGSEIAYLQSKKEELSGMLRTDDALRNLIEKLSEFEAKLSSSGSENGENIKPFYTEGIVTAEELDNKVSLLLEQMQNYFKAEAAIMKFLSDRVVKMKVEHKDLQGETMQFQALGLTTNVNQMNQSLQEISRNISDDEGVMSALRLDAEKMNANLIDQITSYINGNRVLSSNQRAALASILQHQSSIGTDYTKLSSFINANDGMNGSLSYSAQQEVLKPTPQAAPMRSVPVTQMQTPVQQQQRATQPDASLKPKLGWAVSKGAPVEKKEVKSLLDIQKEEMSAKQTS